MRLKKIRLAGFKSFVDPTNIPFPDDMTAIVGPNGCGKSNTIDAVRWVLGESSAKNLRGDAMTDVIFNGSSARKPVGQCSVELVFDNVSQRLQGEYGKYNELSIKRVVTREAVSTYFLNGAKCRRRDVTDLFLGTGLGPRSYAIIEQGMISRLIESRPQDLRIFIEEAAGISKYKERRRETENRIRHTQENLERLTDVREELGKQLDKLQRQAAAAKRYKELKSRERTYKGELAALRWLKYSTQADQLQQQIEQLENSIQALVTEQQGSQSNVYAQKQRQQELVQTLEDIQQQYFKVGTDITRLEQSQMHAKSRQQQVQRELEQLSVSTAQWRTSEQQLAEQLQLAQQALTDLEPEYEIAIEQTEQSQLMLEQRESELEQHERQWQQQERTLRDKQQQLQRAEGQWQSSRLLLARSEERLQELRAQEQQPDATVPLQQLQDEVAMAAEQEAEAEQLLTECNERLEKLRTTQATQQQQQLQYQGQVQQHQAQLESLQSMQLSEGEDAQREDWLQDSGIAYQPLWEWLQVEPEWRAAVELVMQDWLSKPVLSEPVQPDCPAPMFWHQSANMSESKVPGSLAEVLANSAVPSQLNRIACAESLAHAQQLLDAGAQSAVTRSCIWIGPDWIRQASENASQGSLSRAAQINTLHEALDEAQSQVAEQSQWLAETEQLIAQCVNDIPALRDKAKQCQRHSANASSELRVAEKAQQTQQQQREQLAQQIAKYAEQKEQEIIQTEQWAEQVQILQSELDELSVNEDNPELKEQLKQQLQQQRQELEQVKSKQHQLALAVQSKQTQTKHLQEQITQQQQLLEQTDERRTLLQLELEELSMPMEEQADQLQALLEQRVELELHKTECADELAEVESVLNDRQKGQLLAQEKINRLKAEQDALRLDMEGHRVRANSVIETLAELKQNLKFVLDNLPAEAEEQRWQKELETTSLAIARLGAVNLAAVEEYEVQAQRKQHLDEQNQDLLDALETLENAIRKIDRETRARFKATFEAVNADLQVLFPKVFGGGAAYLALTDDDLLETGVAIMAQPPGKKNSTIHLLSGGEKALTALSLVFAIFRLNPAPFCMLDEVDAPLDDANVVRFCNLVSEMSKSVQFIYITHNKIAMEMATHLTGVTMAEPGVSRMVAVDVEQAVALAEQ